MNEIEAKRKELENGCGWERDNCIGNVSCNKVNGYCTSCIGIKEGFEIGVELAQKEFLDKLNTTIRRHLNLEFNRTITTESKNDIIDFIIQDFKSIGETNFGN